VDNPGCHNVAHSSRFLSVTVACCARSTAQHVCGGAHCAG
jgi:hypothetical protein